MCVVSHNPRYTTVWAATVIRNESVGCGLHESSVAGFGKRQYSGGYEVSTRSNTETFFMLSGIATITDEDGTTHELSKGSWYTLPTGWSGRWDIEGKMRKLYILTK